MTKRNIILIIVFTVAALLAVLIAYRVFYNGADSGQGDILGTSPGEVVAVASILSQGTTLDLDPIKKYNSQQQLFNYPKVSSDQLNLPLPDLIK